MEALVIGTGASMFGNLTYTQMLTNILNPTLNPQLEIYDSVQVVLSAAIVNLSRTGPTNVGAGRRRSRVRRRRVAMGEARAHAEGALPHAHGEGAGRRCTRRCSPRRTWESRRAAGNFNAVFTGDANQQNFWYQFDVVQRPGYLLPDPQFVEPVDDAQRSAASRILQRRRDRSGGFVDRAQSHAAAGHGERDASARGRSGAANGQRAPRGHEAESGAARWRACRR